ncbi:glycosyl hydrolase family 43 [Anseongella ginsenosidimutans]|uniref:Glycosyl hydrolase family 43 n=1 Tax=Anseongella ginsenosidimutans TaxID=496056 RepID=A0A4R3KXU4_9SPHI|nr:glycoside hydrolase family 43 protein [Anseongella ginsenosidimutans]QEC51238.1 family 43 glycosylhydrolase [Anseongella ginsenosidimutans]TCS90084.1 glycosyl hydrolase family 43 [Anseongella ginsenosidimutans]
MTKRNHAIIAFLLLTAGFSYPAAANTGLTASAPDTAGQRNMLFGDPYILLHEGTYYMYGTSADDGIEVYTSDDLQHWKGPAGLRNGLALHKEDVWGDRWFWAPEVYALNGRFYMYFSADEHINVAVSDSPLGPFVQEKQEPMLETKAIDNHLFFDEDGTPYIYFVNFNDGLSVWVAELNEDLLSMKTGTMKECVRPEQAWEKKEGSVNEGPYVMKHADKYYLFYSGNGYTSQEYGVGFAVAGNAMGPWKKFAGNPILQSPDTLRGVGHGAFFKDKEGRLNYVYHAHNSRKKIHPRKVYINRCEFVKQEGVPYPVLRMLPPRQTPLLGAAETSRQNAPGNTEGMMKKQMPTK